MPEGIRVELAVACDDRCPIAAASNGVDGAIDDVTRSVIDGHRVDEYRVPRGIGDPDGTPVFATRDEVVYRTALPCGEGCPCEVIEAQGCPVADVRAVDGRLVVVFYTPDRRTLRRVVDELVQSFDVSLHRLVTSDGTGDRDSDGPGRRSDVTVVDRSRLTDRQREVIEAAHAMGYFEYPRRTTAEAAAAALDVSPSAFAETLRAAERTLLEGVFPPESGSADASVRTVEGPS
jgi:hypothetical protein